MPSELEELVEFLHHGNTQIRQIACENLVGYSSSQPSLFKYQQLTPIKDLKLLSRDYVPIARNALTILINLSTDQEILESLAEDDAYLETLLSKVTNPKDPHLNEITMLLANLAKSDSMKRIVGLERAVPQNGLSTSSMAMDQLMDCFVKTDKSSTTATTISKDLDVNYDYLSYVFADLSKFEEGRKYFTTRQAYDGVIPITKLTTFTEHHSTVRRKGVASTIKNVAFEIDAHPSLIAEDQVNLLPYILLPIAGPEELDAEDMDGMLPDLQLLPPDKERDSDIDILVTHIETLLLLCTTREGRDKMRAVKVYPLIRECDMHLQNDKVGEACNRLVQMLMRGEAEDAEKEAGELEKARQKALEYEAAKKPEEDEDEQIEEIF